MTFVWTTRKTETCSSRFEQFLRRYREDEIINCKFNFCNEIKLKFALSLWRHWKFFLKAKGGRNCILTVISDRYVTTCFFQIFSRYFLYFLSNPLWISSGSMALYRRALGVGMFSLALLPNQSAMPCSCFILHSMLDSTVPIYPLMLAIHMLLKSKLLNASSCKT